MKLPRHFFPQPIDIIIDGHRPASRGLYKKRALRFSGKIHHVVSDKTARDGFRRKLIVIGNSDPEGLPSCINDIMDTVWGEEFFLTAAI